MIISLYLGIARDNTVNGGAWNMSTQLLSVMLIFAGVCVADPPEKTEYTDSDIEKLVAQLVSPNQAPEIPATSANYGPNFDRKAQKLVHESWQSLRRLAPRSFPFVFDSLEDKRYSLTEDSGDLEKNYTVGFLARDILVSSLQPDVWDHKEFGTSYRRRPRQPDYVSHYKLLSPKSAKDWWKTRKDRSLRELQIEVLAWIHAEERKAPEWYTDVDRNKIQKELDDLKASSVPRSLGFPFSR